MKENKVLIVFPGLSLDVDEGAKHRLNCHINEFYARGYEVTVLAICKSGIFRKDRKSFMNPNANWILMPYILPISKNLLLSRMLDIYMGLVLTIVTWLNKYDIVQMEVQNIRTRMCAPSVYVTDVHGDMLHEFVETNGSNTKSWFTKYLIAIQKKIAKYSDYCIVVSEKLKEQIEKNTDCRILKHSIISCGVDYFRFANAKKQSIHIDLSDRIVIGYSGGLQAWQNFDKMIEIVIELRKRLPQVFFLIYTNNSVDGYIEELSLIGEENYLVKPLMSSEVPGYLKLFDAGFLLRDDKILNKVSSPTKICEYLAAGVPVICTQYSGDYERSILDRKNGFVLRNSSITQQEFIELLDWLVMVKKNRKQIALECEQAAAKRTFSEEFDNYYNELMIVSHHK